MNTLFMVRLQRRFWCWELMVRDDLHCPSALCGTSRYNAISIRRHFKALLGPPIAQFDTTALTNARNGHARIRLETILGSRYCKSFEVCLNHVPPDTS